MVPGASKDGGKPLLSSLLFNPFLTHSSSPHTPPHLTPPQADGVARNRTDPEGVLFMPRPPDLRREPKREAFAADAKAHKPTDGCDSILKSHDESELEAHASSWLALRKLHSSSPHCGAVPNMPHKVVVSGSEETERRGWLPKDKEFTSTFKGSPCPLLPMLKAMRRFTRPLITWNPFEDEPPASFPSSAVGGQSDPKQPTKKGKEAPPALDPLKRNSIEHQGFKHSERERAVAEKRRADWAAGADSRLESTEKDRLYVVRFEDDDGNGDGELKVGLVVSGETNTDGVRLCRCVYFLSLHAHTHARARTHTHTHNVQVVCSRQQQEFRMAEECEVWTLERGLGPRGAGILLDGG